LSKLVITGGSGTLGTAIVKKCLAETESFFTKDIKSILIVSRNENQQYKMQRDLGGNVDFALGDVRDFESMYKLIGAGDLIIHAAAIKHIDVAERNPDEAIKTNVMGALNMISAAEKKGAQAFLGISTDKACNPNSTYGTTKLLAEKTFIRANENSNTKFANARFGNLLGSSGSVFHLWKKLSIQNNPLPVTSKDMTRYFLEVEMAASFVLRLFNKMQGGETFVPKLTSFKIDELARHIQPSVEPMYIGLRLGEKLHEELIGSAESHMTKEDLDMYVIEPSDPQWDYSPLTSLISVAHPVDSTNYTSLSAAALSRDSKKYELTPSKMLGFLNALPNDQ
jgi:UDP-N-acetylglucosamine 4,6-dehydratase